MVIKNVLQLLTNFLETSNKFCVTAKVSGVFPSLSALSKLSFSERKNFTPFPSVSHLEAAWTMKCSDVYEPKIQHDFNMELKLINTLLLSSNIMSSILFRTTAYLDFFVEGVKIIITISAILDFFHTLVTVHFGDINKTLDEIQTPLVSNILLDIRTYVYTVCTKLL